MSVRTLAGMIASVRRALGEAASKVPIGDVQQAIFNTNLEVHGRYAWPWLYKEIFIGLNGPYSTGTVTVTDASTTVTGSGTTWDTTWRYKRLTVGQSNADWLVASFGSATTLTLVQAPHLDSVTDQPYTIFQDVYALPSDWSPGTDIILTNPHLRYEIRKIPAYTLSQQAAANINLLTTYTLGYSDYGFDDTNKVYLIRLTPPPASTDEYKMVYRRRAPNLSLVTDTALLPEEFCEYLELMAEAQVKRTHRIPGYVEAERKAVLILRAMKRQVGTQGIVNMPRDHGDWGGDSSFQDGILAINPGGWR